MLLSNKLQRIPPYILAKVTQETKIARARGEDIIDYGMGNPDLPTPAHIVNKLVEAASKPANHRYSVSRGIYKLRLAICDWYQRRYGVTLNPDTEAIATIGAKEGISHFMLGLLNPGDTVIVPTPCYPIHAYSVVIAEGNVISIPTVPGEDLFAKIAETCRNSWPKPKAVIVSFPHNPTGAVVQLDFFERLVALARQEEFLIIHDHAYAELCFDGYKSPSLFQVPGAKDVGVEFYSLSKSYNMPGWRVGFMTGNAEAVALLARIKGYLDYGMFAPIQIAAIAALNESQDCVAEIVAAYRARRDVLVDGLNKLGWETPKPQGTMFVWSRLPTAYRRLSSVDFAIQLLREAKVSVAPGAGFGEGGEGYVRFALIENEERTRQALRGIKKMLGA
ncbi:MAG: aminotransferase class I/II-fold pyridoxal phosphate-dependent enzyme [Candidatus Firestonebacteria bacterium]|nr:aminotransferase class I/II-fold pyridoxal phosphate-dependent enzyme [Candidatus Firestonebacteria bacterium]